MKHSESVTEIFAALAAFQAEVEDPKMDEEKEYVTKQGRKIVLKYATIRSILKTIRPVLAKHGICLMQEPRTENNKVTITTFLLHKSGEWIECEAYSLYALSATAQEIGSATTYARRYSLSALLGLGSEDDDDGNGASEGINGNEKPPAPPAAKKTATPPAQAPAQTPKQAPAQPKPAPQQKPAPAQPPKSTADGFTETPAVNDHGQPLISKQQANQLFYAAGKNAELLKSVMHAHGYVLTKEIEAKDFDILMKEVNEKMAQLSGKKVEQKFNQEMNKIAKEVQKDYAP